MKRIMIDIETLGRDERALIMQVGIVAQAEGNVPEVHCFNLNWLAQQDCARPRTIEVETLQWWLAEPTRAQQFTMIAKACAATHGLKHNHNINEIASILNDADEVWANSPSFDVRILNTLLDENLCPTIPHKVERDFRTARALYPTIRMVYAADAHNAAADAEAQVLHLMKIGIWPCSGPISKPQTDNSAAN